ncbi:hypothetical protein MUP38_00780 [Candidatus Bathyarchaeota archaeon]|nr:hypothetical protein [Candidatus Bathyarchaeota archaeon]
MPKGKPWLVEEERQLRKLRGEGKTVVEIALRMKQTPDAIKQKLRRLGLKVVTLEKSIGTTTSELIMPEELPSVEEALKDLVAAMNALKTPGLSKTEIMRLRSLIQTSGLYQHRLAEYVDFRGIEREMIDLGEKYEALAKREQDRLVTARIVRRGVTRSRTIRLSGTRPASFIHPGNQATDAEVKR